LIAVLKDMKDEEVLFQSKKRRKALRQAAAEEAAQAENDKGEEAKITETEDGRVKVESVNGVRFY
jgi:ribosomal protein L12E/L44/L45/RPP1/RPP2